MARFKLSMEDVNQLVEWAIGGKVASELVDGQKRFGIKIRFPINRIATIKEVEGPAQISREDNKRKVVVETNVRGRDLGSFVDDAKVKLAGISNNLPTGYWIEYGGTFESQTRAMKRLAIVVPITTVLGLLPMVYAVGPGAEVQRPLAVVVIGGLVTSTILTLFVLPTLYQLFDPKIVD